MKSKNKKPKQSELAAKARIVQDGNRKRKLKPMPKEKFDWRQYEEE